MRSATEVGMWLSLPADLPPDVRDSQSFGRGAVFELCQRCWQPVLLGMLDAHLAAVVHRDQPGPELP